MIGGGLGLEDFSRDAMYSITSLQLYSVENVMA